MPTLRDLTRRLPASVSIPMAEQSKVSEPEQDVQITRCQFQPNMFATISRIQARLTNCESQPYRVTLALNGWR
jgi:hypothetical protein